jgi:dTDP-4-amino-4,6-dideoxygalactose transaminase
MINVTKTYLPPKTEYDAMLQEVWDSSWITNNGPMVQRLEAELKSYLGVKYLLYVNNGTIALQLALKALDLSGEIITTPFSYCATTTSILWENCKPVFADIESKSFNIDAHKIEALITENTTGIMATHVYGRPCDVEKIENIAQKHNLKVIYDAAHTFGSTLNGKSLVNFGDVSTLSFHATKLFHTVEGGAIVCQDEAVYRKLFLQRMFGHEGDEHYMMGINGKSSEFHAAMGLCILPKINELIRRRTEIADLYNQHLNFNILKQPKNYLEGTNFNNAYYAVVFQNEAQLLKLTAILKENGINIRRYFYPSLNKLTYLKESNDCPISEDISVRVASLPSYYDLANDDIIRICGIINENLG